MNLLLVTTPSKVITFKFLNCPITDASMRKSIRFLCDAPGYSK
jgi:hypothetical protein